MEQFRTKASIEAGLIINSKPNDFLQFIEYQPGNGTRYVLLIQDTRPLGVRANEAIGFDAEGGYVVSFPDGAKYNLVKLARHGYIERTWFAEKLGTRSESDAAVLAELLGYLLGRKAEPAGP